MIFHMI